MKKSLKINVKEETKPKDHLETYKKWFNGLKHFYTVKVNPPSPK